MTTLGSVRTIYKVLLLLFAIELLLAFICGPHSCEWGNTVYFYFGIAILLTSFTLPLLQKNWRAGKRAGYASLFLIASLAVWVLGFALGNFTIMCRLF